MDPFEHLKQRFSSYLDGPKQYVCNEQINQLMLNQGAYSPQFSDYVVVRTPGPEDNFSFTDDGTRSSFHVKIPQPYVNWSRERWDVPKMPGLDSFKVTIAEQPQQQSGQVISLVERLRRK